ncbi:pPIWI_RE module domain-containing protein [Paenibacillus sp. Soil724D2]|uniref:pPIWI_RE module domain-containing protein n=1 Tax=Paenibacillus sp. (strain Soil724D2) TaxID=1736392 RepID=UPI000713AF56|nr:DUF3962 domain-containing protein [Paenibacillus sp. Soil724D2]KRE50656.1 hypothetical protein ASG85_20610 [Paenibacillus sp. Soil724D2]
MSKREDLRLLPLALEVNETEIRQIQVYRLDMPLCWVEYINQFRKDANNPFKLTISIEKLAAKLQSLFPEIVWMNNQVYFKSGSAWIISVVPIPIEMIITLCMSWFEEVKSKSKLNIQPPEEPLVKDLEWMQLQSGDVLSRDNEYQVIPALMAHQFCKSPKQLIEELTTELPQELNFYQVHVKEQAECMSERISTKKGDYAYVIRIRMKTRATQADQHVIMLSFGIRRFITQSYIKSNDCFVDGETKSSMLVSMDNPFLRKRGLDSRSYAKIRFQRKGNQAPYTKWIEGSDSIFWDVLWGQSIRSDSILENPTHFLEADSPIQVHIVYNRLFKHAKVPGAGIGFPEKEALFRLFCEEFSNWKPLEALPEVKRRTEKKPGLTSLPLFYSRYSKNLTIEVFGSSNLFEQLEEVLVSTMGANKESISIKEADGCYKLNCNNDIHIRLVHKVSDLMGSLDIDTYKDQAFEQRVKKIETELANENPKVDTVVSLIEIYPRDYYKPEDADPKSSIREGLRRTGRINQFVHPQSDVDSTEFHHRVSSALLDLLSDTGIVGRNVVKIPNEINILGFDIVEVKKRNSNYRNSYDNVYVPVFTKFRYGALYLRGWGMNSWLSLHDAQLCADQFKGWKKKDEQLVLQLLEEVLTDEVIDDEETYILLNAELRKDFLKALRNGQIKLDQNPLLFSRIQDLPGINVIRINATDEVPAYLFEPRSYASGVFKDEKGLYYGVGKKMSTLQIKKTKTKYAYPNEFFRQPSNTEYLPLGFKDEAARDRAALLIHDLRDVGITFDTHTSQPYPFHMLRSLKKYMNEVSYQEWEIEPEFAEGE